ncbi:VCBS repeat-containing protein [Nonomuraea sp. NPDC049725]|uniref:FG-GAP and VCBS repeat-containing protein n=1 Tax=Nonomuraea sp. NPDC049725 TaxID=3154508 RepID=UPI0034364590
MRRVVGAVMLLVTLAACAPPPETGSPPATSGPPVTSGPPATSGSPTTSGPPATPGPPTTSGPPATSSGPSAGKPVGRGRPGDLDGDGYADLVFASGDRLDVVRGSRTGLDPATRVSVPADRFRVWLISQSVHADLDADGYGDVVVHGGPPDGEMAPHVLWGGPQGVGLVPVRVGRKSLLHPVTGDFDGDGVADVAAPASGRTALVLLYGPFTREGVPAREETRPSPSGGEFWRLAAGPIGAGRRTGLLVYEGDDGEQVASRLLRGPGEPVRRLNAGMASAFGDFDGDGREDVAVGDDGGRNNEPGFETEPPGVDRTLTVYYAGGRVESLRGAKGGAAAGDFDGDGDDDVAFGGFWPDTPSGPRLFRGGPGGLRDAGPIGAGRGLSPLTAGDYDGDGDDELVLASEKSVAVSDGRGAMRSFSR